LNTLRFSLCLTLLGLIPAAYAAQPAGRVVCTSNQGNLAFNVSYFNLGVVESSSSSSSGAGAGKVTFQPLVVHAALSSFETLFQQTVSGGHFSTCTLTMQASNGDRVQFTMQLVAVDSVNAIASSATSQSPNYAYVEAHLLYGAVQVSAPNGADDGGSSPAIDRAPVVTAPDHQ
jgi:Type VI secretion system effector, Hcp